MWYMRAHLSLLRGLLRKNKTVTVRAWTQSGQYLNRWYWDLTLRVNFPLFLYAYASSNTLMYIELLIHVEIGIMIVNIDSHIYAKKDI